MPENAQTDPTPSTTPPDAAGNTAARGILYDPRWPWHAAAALGDSVVSAPQYLRCEPREARGVFEAR